MSKKKYKPALDFVVPLNINHLQGRMLNAPAISARKREILLVYGHHSSIERMVGFVEELRRYGNVTLPDLPGFGGMKSFYTIGTKPTLDNLADYLAAFVKLKYRRKRVTILGMSFGFLIVTKMLQKYPELTKKVDTLVSVVGFVHKDDFLLPKKQHIPLRIMSSVVSRRTPAWLVSTFLLRAPVIRAIYGFSGETNPKLKGADEAQKKDRVNFEITLWKQNDIRTYMDTMISMFKANLCDKHVELPVYHVSVEHDRYFDNHRVEQHLGIIFEAVYIIPVKELLHAPTVVATAKEASAFIPAKLRRLLS